MGEPPLYKSNGCPGTILPITPENYGSEDRRKESFVGWPLNAEVPPEILVRVGYVYTGKGTLVQCFCCGAQYQDWRKGDNPLGIHQKRNPQCSFPQTLTCKRKPPTLTCKRKPPKQPQQKSSLLLEPHANDHEQYSCQTMHDCDGVSQHNVQSSCGDTVNNAPGDVLPFTQENYQYETARLNSFVGWPIKEIVHPVKLAGVGFVYTGKGSLVQCFQCGIKYRNWNKLGQEIAPFDIHHHCNPRCPFLQTLKLHQCLNTNKCNRALTSVPSCETNICTKLSRLTVDDRNMPTEAEREKLCSKIYPACQQPLPQSVVAMPLRHLLGHPYLAVFPDDTPSRRMPQQYHEQSDRGGIDPFTCDTHADTLMDPPQQIPEENRPPVLSRNNVEKPLHDVIKPRTVYTDAQVVRLIQVCYLFFN